MSVSAQSKAVAWGNSVIALCSQMVALEAQLIALVSGENSGGDPKSILGNFATAPQNPDGSLGNADGAPNPAHKIDTRPITQQGIANACSFNDLQNAYGCLQDILAAIQGTRDVPQTDRRTAFYPVSGS